MFCSQCGTQATLNDRICQSCSHVLSTTDPASPAAGAAAKGSPDRPIGEPSSAQRQHPPGNWSDEPIGGVAASPATGGPDLFDRASDDAPIIASRGGRASALLIDIVIQITLFLVIAFVFIAVLSVVQTINQVNVEETPLSDREAGLLFGSILGTWAVALFLMTWAFNATGGTVGKRILGLRIVRHDLQPPGWKRGIGRTLGAWLSWIPVGLGFLWGTWDDSGQTWHDKMSGAYVVRVDSLPVRPVPAAQPSSLH